MPSQHRDGQGPQLFSSRYLARPPGPRVSILGVLRLRDGVPALPLPLSCTSRGQRWAGGGTETLILCFGPGLLYLLLPEPRTGSAVLSLLPGLFPPGRGDRPPPACTLSRSPSFRKLGSSLPTCALARSRAKGFAEDPQRGSVLTTPTCKGCPAPTFLNLH